jgi:zinc protease
MATAAALRPVVRRQLDNGLTAIVRSHPGVPIGSFWVWYRVGGRNEVPGITGISHWVEHMLFKGTQEFGAGEVFRQISATGGSLNGFTWIDFTTYFETLPIDRIDLAMRIESDRMINARFDPDEVASERTVIISERQGNENQPMFFLREEVSAAAFRAHPYGQGVIGHLSDLEGITREELYGHYQTYYRPNNAIAVFVGDLDEDEAFARIEKAFGSIEAGPEISPVRTREPEPQGERRVTVRRPAPSRVLQIVYLAPNASDADTPALMVADAILSGAKSFGLSRAGGTLGRSSRLYRSLVSTGLASSAGSSFALTIDPYLFGITVNLRPESDPELVESVVNTEVARLANEVMLEDEFSRAMRQMRAQIAYAQETVTSQAYWLGSLATVAPDRDPDEFMSEIEAVTPGDVQRVVARYLQPLRSTVGWLIPTEDDLVDNGAGTRD